MLNWLLDKLQKRAQTLTARQGEMDRPGSASEQVDELVRRGYQLHSAGDLDGAEAVYRKILFGCPGHADTLYLLGEIQLQKGVYDQAIALINKAVAANPGVGAYYASLGNLYKLTGDLSNAEASFRQALALEQTNAEYVNDLGTVLQDQRRYQEALACFDRALNLVPDMPQALYNKGMVFRQQSRLGDAALLMEQALAHRPDFIEGFGELGQVHLLLGQHEQALSCFKKAYGADKVSKTEIGEAYFQYGNQSLDQHNAEDAVLHYLRALDLGGATYETWANLGNAYRELKQFADAIRCQLVAVKLNPSGAQAFGNLGVALKELGDCNRAREVYREVAEAVPHVSWPIIDAGDPFCDLAVALHLIDHALTLDTRIADFYLNKGVMLEELGRFEEGKTCFDRVVELSPELPHGHFNLGIAFLRQGMLREGWKGYDARLRLEKFLNQRLLAAAPLWDGRPLSEQVLLVHAEQGLGDTIQFIRYYKDVRSLCQKVVVECQEAAKPLVEEITGEKNVYVAGTPLPGFDFQIPLLSLPGVLGTRLENIPAEIPYIQADAALAAGWKDAVTQARGLNVGLVWAGGAAFAGNRFRSTALSMYSPLGEVEGVNFFSLQKGGPEQEAKNPPPGMNLNNCSDRLRDFRDTAALIANLDLVISVDTSVAHLAGAMGKPVWVLIPFCPDWRWMLARTDSPWYPTMRLFRQTRIGDWQECMGKIKGELAKLSAEKQSSC